jgi:hypothetical protein
MQIIHPHQLYTTKENNQETVHQQQEENRGNQSIIKLGDESKCPQCDRTGRVVWISQDRKTAGIQCPASHQLANRPDSKFGSAHRSQSKSNKKLIFLTEI